jgi:phage terminase large subunit
MTAARRINITIDKDVYNPVYIPYLSNPRPTEILFGGSSSGKSHFIAQRAVEEVMQGGHNYLICRKNANSIAKSIFNEIHKAIFRLRVPHLFDIVPSRSEITCKNGYQIVFAGLDDVEKVKSITPKKGVITDIIVEEATETAKGDIKQLEKRLRGLAQYKGKEIPKRLILLFNPILKTHWIYLEYFKPNNWRDNQETFENDVIRILKTTHIHNMFLTQADHDRLENEPDLYWRNVYTYGNWGVLGDTILTNWRTEDLSRRINEFTNIRNGLDFGYADDPNAYVKIHFDAMRKQIFIFRAWHQGGMTNPQIAAKLKPDVGDEPIFCDSAEPKSIKELNDDGIDARAVKKGPDSVLFSIKWLQQYEIIVDEMLQGVVNELGTWAWKKDKYGVSLPIPEDKNDHYIAATRYALEIEYMGMKGMDLS